jgi:hypothetical protein
LPDHGDVTKHKSRSPERLFCIFIATRDCLTPFGYENIHRTKGRINARATLEINRNSNDNQEAAKLAYADLLSR